MSLKKSKGNMYSWVSHMHTHLGGECQHKCCYCYIENNRFGRPERYKGDPQLIEKELCVDYGKGKAIFIEHMSDLFAENILDEWILKILAHCEQFKGNNYIFQTKNPTRAYKFLHSFPKNFIIGTTIETNRDMPDISNAPKPSDRYVGIWNFTYSGCKTFITIEPILDFDPILSDWIIAAKPSFVNIGADSKGCGLPEPTPDKILNLITALNGAGIEIREKYNLKRIIGPVNREVNI